MAYMLLALNVLLMAGGQLLFKKSADFITANPQLHFPMNYLTNVWFYIAIFLFASAALVWTQILTKVPLSVAYPIASSAYILTIAGAYFIFKEQVGLLDYLGVVLIITGITLTALR
jgi:multidrug transporter EmrE-like cation transporter